MTAMIRWGVFSVRCKWSINFCLPCSQVFTQFCLQWATAVCCDLLSSVYQSHLCRKLKVSGSFILTTMPTPLFYIQSFASDRWHGRMTAQLTCPKVLSSASVSKEPNLKHWVIEYVHSKISHKLESFLKMFVIIAKMSTKFHLIPQ